MGKDVDGSKKEGVRKMRRTKKSGRKV